MSNQTARSSGIGLCGATFLVFLVARLTDYIDWAWYWVAAPLWMPVGLAVGVTAAIFLCLGLAMPFAWFIDWRRARRRARFRRARDVRS